MSTDRSSRESVKNARKDTGERPGPLAQIAESLRGLQFGQLTILVQDGVVIQIERTEKRRLR